MPYNLLLLPLLGGFLFLHLAHRFRFRAQRLDGYRLLVESALAGIVLLTAARTLVVIASSTQIGFRLGPLWEAFSPFSYSDTGALSLLLGPVLALIMNRFVTKSQAKDLEIRSHGNSLVRLLHQAEQSDHFISITLDSRKWYVGFVAESPNLDPQELYFRILPFVSGYREKDTLQPVRTVSYENVLSDANMDHSEFVITIPFRDVKIANLFDEDVYQDYFARPTS